MTLTLGRGNGIIIGNPGGITLATSRGAFTVGGAGGVALRQGDPLRLSGGNVVAVSTGTTERQVYVQADRPTEGDVDWLWVELDENGEPTGNEYFYDAEG